jgi:hypothetical protein
MASPSASSAGTANAARSASPFLGLAGRITTFGAVGAEFATSTSTAAGGPSRWPSNARASTETFWCFRKLPAGSSPAASGRFRASPPIFHR